MPKTTQEIGAILSQYTWILVWGHVPACLATRWFIVSAHECFLVWKHDTLFGNTIVTFHYLYRDQDNRATGICEPLIAGLHACKSGWHAGGFIHRT